VRSRHAVDNLKGIIVKNLHKAAITVAISAGLVLSAAAGANAVGIAPTIPDGFELYMPSCSPSGQLYQINDATAAGTAIGSPNVALATDSCPIGAAYNPADGKFYMLESDASFSSPAVLYTMDPTTGVFTAVATTDIIGYNFMIDNEGNAFTTSAGVLYSLNLADGTTTAIGTNGVNDYCLAVNPLTDLITHVDYNTGAVTTISKTDGTVTSTGVTITYPAGADCYAMAIDGNGVAWMGQGSSPYLLFTANLATGAVNEIGDLLDGSTDLPVTALAVGRPTAAALPNTGVDSTSLALVVGGVSALMLAGASLLVGLRRRSN
jgi:LPXTG-motif cell wall-anchored protein